MIFCDHGIVLNRRQLRENDRIVTVFTEAGGKLEVNFKSVRLARGKLRALSEPLSWSDFRFYLKKGSNFPVCTGGRSLSVFAGLRGDLDRLCLGLHYCEIVNRLTPAQQPAPEKYALSRACSTGSASARPRPGLTPRCGMSFTTGTGPPCARCPHTPKPAFSWTACSAGFSAGRWA
ncbi:MAG: DNA repair protein RecO [Elusimicrobia bacterium]|nr:DNA repair protein RecO [Elusimicrobiota bacterium]